jgi:tetratricopeptide (TPR) repeat protein
MESLAVSMTNIRLFSFQCLKDWAEILHAQKKFDEAEQKIRTALQLLEYKDSDALFTLGVLLSEQGRDDESIEAYKESVELNAEDAELWYAIFPASSCL